QKAAATAPAPRPADRGAARLEQLHQQEQQQRVLCQRPLTGPGDPILRPARYDALPRETQTFLDQEVLHRLSELEKRGLKQAEGKWPDYPRYVAQLADRYPVLPEGPLGKVASPGELPTGVKERLERNRQARPPSRLEGQRPDYPPAPPPA